MRAAPRERRFSMNIIVVIADTFRYDNIYPLEDNPLKGKHLEEFARQGVSLSHFYTGSFPTIPQRTDFTTGRVGWPWYPWQALQLSGNNHLPKLLGEAGYVSQLLGDCPHLINSRFDLGFDGFHTLRGQEGNSHFLRLNHEIRETIPVAKTRTGSGFMGRNLPDLHRWTNQYFERESETFAYRTANKVEEWLEENYLHDSFFLWVDFFDPHEPWDPPEYLVRKYDQSGYNGPPMIHPNYGMASDLNTAELQNLKAHYLAEAFIVDRAIGRILTKIEDLDLYSNSIVVFMSDHGMSLGEHNRTGKSNINTNDDRYWPIYSEVAHCPFIVRAPGLPAGTSVDSFIQPADIQPTLLELAGLQLRPLDPWHGHSFTPQLRGQAPLEHRDFAVTAGHLRQKDGRIPDCAVTPVVYTSDWAYIPIGPNGDSCLHDRQADPDAKIDVAADHPTVAREMQERLNTYLEELGAPEAALEAIQPL